MQSQTCVFLFYDAPTPPPGIFDAFLAIPDLQKVVSTQSYLSLVRSLPNQLVGTRYALQSLFSLLFRVIDTPESGIFNTVSFLSLTPSLLYAIVNETSVSLPRTL